MTHGYCLTPNQFRNSLSGLTFSLSRAAQNVARACLCAFVIHRASRNGALV